MNKKQLPNDALSHSTEDVFYFVLGQMVAQGGVDFSNLPSMDEVAKIVSTGLEGVAK